MSTNFSDEDRLSTDWVSQAEAARIHGVSRQAIHKLVRNGRLRTISAGGRLLVSRTDVESFHPNPAGRPTLEEDREFERVKAIVDACDFNVKDRLYRALHSSRSPHPIEAELNTSSEVILEALHRAGELTIRMFRGVLAEAAFDVHVVRRLPTWKSEGFQGNTPYDFQLDDGKGPVTIQVKLQRSEKGKPKVVHGGYVVETQKTRGGVDRSTGEKTRSYRFGEFDILAVSLHPSTGRWDVFRYTVANRLLPAANDPRSLATLQPVSIEPDADWTDDLEECIAWFRQGTRKTIQNPGVATEEDS